MAQSISKEVRQDINELRHEIIDLGHDIRQGAGVADIRQDVRNVINTVADLIEDIAVCYRAGTAILTPEGEVKVEDLEIGDRVVTLSGEAKRIKWIGRRAYDGRFIAGNRDVLPIRIRQGALGDNLPHRDLYVSPKHALFLDGVLVPAEKLVNGVSIAQEEAVETVAYYHLEVAEHDVIYAEGAAAETYIDCGNRAIFHNAAEFDRLHPGEPVRQWAYCAPLVEDGPELDRLRRGLAERAATIATAERSAA